MSHPSMPEIIISNGADELKVLDEVSGTNAIIGKVVNSRGRPIGLENIQNLESESGQ